MVANPFQTPPVMILIAHLALVAVQVHLLQIGRKIVQEAVPPSHHRPILLLDRAQIVHLPNRQDPNSSKLINQRVKIVTNKKRRCQGLTRDTHHPLHMKVREGKRECILHRLSRIPIENEMVEYRL